MAVTDTAVLLLDCRSRFVREVGVLDARTINALHVLPRCPATGGNLQLAVACSDGLVKIMDVPTRKISRELTSGHKKLPSFHHLVAFRMQGGPKGDGASPPQVGIIAAAADGNLYMWHLQHSEMPVCCVSVGTEVCEMRLSDSEVHQRLVTTHADKTLAQWAVGSSIQEIIRAKPRSKV